ncbi:TPA: hypothetical protein DIS61_00020 [Patescibacteria group bacterium]|nr:hypothetical protein [Patescibacteria group bacterium]
MQGFDSPSRLIKQILGQNTCLPAGRSTAGVRFPPSSMTINIEAQRILREFVYQQRPEWGQEERYSFKYKVSVLFNNWHANLPGGAYRNYPLNLLEERYPRGNSRTEMSTIDLFSRIDQTLARHGIDQKEIVKLQEERKQHDPDAYINLIVLTLPAFRTLLEEGFLLRDLVE